MRENFLRHFAREAQWAIFVVTHRLKNRLLALKRIFVKPSFPENSNGQILIHLGCGDIASPEFINVDARPGPHVHHICDVTDLSVFSDGYADLVYACHVLEHVKRTKLRETLWEWRRILKPGGILRISVPDFDKILDIYHASARDINSILGPLMGGQQHKYNVHYSVFNQKYLADRLKEVGFKEIRQWDPGLVENHNFKDWANSEIVRNGKSFPVSLNLEAVR